MKYAIRVKETKQKTFIVEADSLDEAIYKLDGNYWLDIDEESDREVSASPLAKYGGIATEEQLKYCEHDEED